MEITKGFCGFSGMSDDKNCEVAKHGVFTFPPGDIRSRFFLMKAIAAKSKARELKYVHLTTRAHASCRLDYGSLMMIDVQLPGIDQVLDHRALVIVRAGQVVQINVFQHDLLIEVCGGVIQLAMSVDVNNGIFAVRG